MGALPWVLRMSGAATRLVSRPTRHGGTPEEGAGGAFGSRQAAAVRKMAGRQPGPPLLLRQLWARAVPAMPRKNQAQQG